MDNCTGNRIGMRKLFFFTVLFTSVLAQSPGNPPCYICGEPDATISNPTAVIPIPPEFEDLVNIDITCQIGKDFGELGFVEPAVCDLLIESQEICGCSNYDVTTRKPSPSPTKSPTDEPLDLPCYICGEPDVTISNPNALLPIPPEFQGSFPFELTCETGVLLEELGISCDILTADLSSIQEICGCSNYDFKTRKPSPSPTKSPTPEPTRRPKPAPTPIPTKSPTFEPTKRPRPQPTLIPTESPTIEPTKRPQPQPTPNPTISPTFEPTERPQPPPTPIPTISPTFEPTERPQPPPTPNPTISPTFEPTERPQPPPTPIPTFIPTQEPVPPTLAPSIDKVQTTTPVLASSSPSSLILPTKFPTTDSSTITEPSAVPFQTILRTTTPSAIQSSNDVPYNFFPFDSMLPSTSPTATPSTSPIIIPTMSPSYKEGVLIPVEDLVENIRIRFENVGLLSALDIIKFESVTEEWFEDYFSAARRRFLQSLKDVIRNVETKIDMRNQKIESFGNSITYNQVLTYTLLPGLSVDVKELVTFPHRDAIANSKYATRLKEELVAFSEMIIPIQIPFVELSPAPAYLPSFQPLISRQPNKEPPGLEDIPNDSKSQQGRSGMEMGAIAAIAAAAVVITVAVLLFLLLKQKQNREARQDPPGMAGVAPNQEPIGAPDTFLPKYKHQTRSVSQVEEAPMVPAVVMPLSSDRYQENES